MSANQPDSMSDSHAHCAALLAEGDRDRWLAALFIPHARRHHIHALYAFSHEIARVSHIVSEPRLGEIRLQWWREVLEGQRSGEALQNPVSAALLATLAACRLPAEPLINLVEARRFDLYSDPMPSLHDLEGYCGETCSALFQLAGLTAAGLEQSGDGAPVAGLLAGPCGHAGAAYAMTGILRALPWHASRGQCYLPGDVLARNGALGEAAAAGLGSPALHRALGELRDKARKHLADARAGIKLLPEMIRPVFTPLAVVPLYLKAMDAPGYNPFRPLIEAAQWRRQWAMWRWK